jgi:chromosome segregation ATPase
MAEESKKNKVVEIVLGVVTAGMVGFMLWLWVFNYKTLQDVAKVSEHVATKQAENYRYVSNEYKVTKNELDETTVKLTQVTEELQAANVELTNTRGELTEVQQLNDQLKTNISALERYKAAAMSKGEALEVMIDSFKRKNKELDQNLQQVRKELAVFQPDIDDISEGRSKVLLFKNHIRMVKRNMGVLKRKAIDARIAAQKEQDRLDVLYGNNGYLVKDGQDKSITTRQKKVDIDVKFVNP